MELIF